METYGISPFLVILGTVPGFNWSVRANGYFLFLRFYLFIHERQREREAETQAEGEAGRLHAGSPMWDSIPGPGDHNPS